MQLPKAIFSKDRKYRYMLTRQWDETLPWVGFCGLNPSTADEDTDDPTIRRCVGFAKAWGYGGVIMVNLFAFRATDPKDMKAADFPVGSENDKYLLETFMYTDLIIAAWGTHGSYWGRDVHVKTMLKRKEVTRYRKVCVLGLTKNGSPKHPLYLKKDLTPLFWG